MSSDGKEYATLEDVERRLKTLSKKKRKLLTTAKRARTTLAKAKAEKKFVLEEEKRLRNARDIFKGMSDKEAQTAVVTEIKSTKPEDIFPEELEKEFDEFDRASRETLTKKQVRELNKEEISNIEGDEEEAEMYSLDFDSGEPVMDLYYGDATA